MTRSSISFQYHHGRSRYQFVYNEHMAANNRKDVNYPRMQRAAIRKVVHVMMKTGVQCRHNKYLSVEEYHRRRRQKVTPLSLLLAEAIATKISFRTYKTYKHRHMRAIQIHRHGLRKRSVIRCLRVVLSHVI